MTSSELGDIRLISVTTRGLRGGTDGSGATLRSTELLLATEYNTGVIKSQEKRMGNFVTDGRGSPYLFGERPRPRECRNMFGSGAGSRSGKRLGTRAMEVCPTDVVHAPAERVWQLFMDPRELTQWTGTKLEEGPARPLRAGDLLVLGAGPFRIRFEVLDAEPPKYARLHIRMFFGVVNHEQFQVTPMGSNICRVTFG